MRGLVPFFLFFGAVALVSGQDFLAPVVVLGERIYQDQPGEAVWEGEEVRRFSPQTVDALLATDPAFSLFRRQNASFGNPTTSGVSLRNTGATAASRSLVLLDGVPQNDPFGGWVNWGRYDPLLISRARVSTSSQASLWGNLSSAGAVHLTSREIEEGQGALSLSAGSQGYLGGSFFYDLGSPESPWRFRVGAHGRDSDGYFVLRSSQRGEIDERANLQSQGAFVQVEWTPSDQLQVQSRLSYYEERRSNGTALTGNTTEGFDYSLRVLGESGAVNWQALAFYQDRTFSSRFSAAAVDRDSERLALDQFDVPGEGIGGGLTLAWDASERLQILGGFDLRFLDGETNENAGAFRSRRAGGEQRIAGAFASIEWDVSEDSRLAASVRLDHWELSDGERVEVSPGSGALLREDAISDRRDWEPSFSLRWRQEIHDDLGWDLAGGSSFRLPNLNELHRPFRVRNDITEANPALDPERFFFLEGGLNYEASDELSVRLGAFHHWIRDAIANVPVTDAGEIQEIFGNLPTGGTGSQRRNVEEARVFGLEGEANWEMSEAWSFSAKALWSRSRFTSVPGQDLIEDEDFPQTPEFAANLNLAYEPTPDWVVSVGVDYESRAFDDLQGERALPEYWTARLISSWQVREDLRIGARVENLFDTEIVSGVASNGLISIGQPRAFWFTAEWQF